MSKVIVGMSGGVDSAVAAYLLKEAGYEVIGIMLRTWSSEQDPFYSKEDGFFVEQNKCCEIDDARAAAYKLGIEFYPINCVREFETNVIAPFVRTYTEGCTPNPCVECNRYVKFEKLLYMADVLKADYIATGHYAKKIELPNGRYTVKMSDARQKDQTYMLYKLSQEQIKRVLFPLGEYDKDSVRLIAKEAGLPVAEKKDSQEICFIPDDDYSGYIKRYIDSYPQTSLEEDHSGFNKIAEEGDFVDSKGNTLGKHRGIIHYTVGQRKGLGLSMGHPVYVTGINADKNQVIVGDEDELFSSEITVKDYNFLSLPDLEEGESVRGRVKIRYHHGGEYALIERKDKGILRIIFDKPVKAATPGQSAVFYDENNCIIGGGIIG